MNQKIIFVAGIHGVGKTTLCNDISAKFDIKYFSSGKLISKINEETFSYCKKVKDISANQNDLLLAVSTYLQEHQWYLLDGHFCVLNGREKFLKFHLLHIRICRLVELSYYSMVLRKYIADLKNVIMLSII